jgi:ABC-type polysaccharide/polyol phosphate transport system ATPase subunit
MLDVHFDHVSKRYRVAAPAVSTAPFFRRLPFRRPTEEFWAVRDVTLQVARGEALGIIGQNGAGKSTLLKLLSRITTPTEGEIRLNGRLAALIELGSGFHPELSGRENVFLSGSLLGMRRREIAEKLDRIVAFSGVGSFIDTPVKRYSSGMFVRLGFAIAAHLDPDILLVDEVLAVGDASFQIQCLDRLNELRRNGTTMLFISHDLLAIEKLCDRVVLMQRGRLVASGAPHEVVESYQQAVATEHVAAVADASPQSGPRAVVIDDIRFHAASGIETSITTTGAPLTAIVSFTARAPVEDAVVEVFYYSRDGSTLFCQQTTALSGGELPLMPGKGHVEFSTEGLGLQPGVYAVGATVRQRHGSSVIDWFYGRTVLYVEPGKPVRGYFYTPHSWRLLPDDAVRLSPGSTSECR